MERYSDRAIEIINELHTERLDYESEYLPLIECANQCKAYEDTGLEPEEITTGKELAEIACALNLLKRYQAIGTVDELSALVKARDEGQSKTAPIKGRH